jgi:hypothetical protein
VVQGLGRGWLSGQDRRRPLNGCTTTYVNDDGASGGAIRRDQRGGIGPILESSATIWSDKNTLAFWANPHRVGELLGANTAIHPTAPGALFSAESADLLLASDLTCAFTQPQCPWQAFDPMGKSGNTTTGRERRGPPTLGATISVSKASASESAQTPFYGVLRAALRSP